MIYNVPGKNTQSPSKRKTFAYNAVSAYKADTENLIITLIK